jgi:hypothetical protein
MELYLHSLARLYGIVLNWDFCLVPSIIVKSTIFLDGTPLDFGRSLPTFRKCLLLPSLWSKHKTKKQLTRRKQQRSRKHVKNAIDLYRSSFFSFGCKT